MVYSRGSRVSGRSSWHFYTAWQGRNRPFHHRRGLRYAGDVGRATGHESLRIWDKDGFECSMPGFWLGLESGTRPYRRRGRGRRASPAVSFPGRKKKWLRFFSFFLQRKVIWVGLILVVAWAVHWAALARACWAAGGLLRPGESR
jgi:hypothetical protein